VQWYKPIIPALGRLRQEDVRFKATPWAIQQDCLKKTKKETKKGESWEPVAHT
jgi:hypothetical protein